MASERLSAVTRQIRRFAAAAGPGDATDGRLLDRYVCQRDEAAFELLVRRHGPMVLGVCRRILRHEQDAENAFQATFLILVRKAGSIQKTRSIQSWLHRVAFRVALRAKTGAGKWGTRLELDRDVPAPESGDLVRRDSARVLDEEVNRLPEKYRTPIILCYLQGKTNEEAARQLDCPQGTVATRLARARDRLRVRLTIRGLGLNAGALTALLAPNATAATLPARLITSTIEAVSEGSGSAAVAGAAASPAAVLAREAYRTMFLSKSKIIGGALVAACILASGAGTLALWAGGDVAMPPEEPASPTPIAKKSQPAAPGQEKPLVAKGFENGPGCRWLLPPWEMGAPGGTRFTANVLVACIDEIDSEGALTVTVGNSGSTVSSPEYFPVAFDVARKRYPLQKGGACLGGSDKKQLEDAARIDPERADLYRVYSGGVVTLTRFRLDPTVLRGKNVAYLGIEVRTPAGRKIAAEKALERAKADGIEVLPYPWTDKPFEFTLTDIHGKKIQSRNLLGKVVLIDCWATGCSPCMAQMPKLKELHEKYKEDGLVIVGVSFDQDREKMTKAIRANDHFWTQVLVPADEKVRDHWREASGISDVPHLLLIDRDGILRADGGPELVEEKVAELLKNSTPKKP